MDAGKAKKSELKNVVVLMGDPEKPDTVKPSGVFDENDMATIRHLKIALSRLKEYKFTYLSNHNSLLNDLIKLKPRTDFVFNLCDEGFINDPRKELHIPALLEMLEYSLYRSQSAGSWPIAMTSHWCGVLPGKWAFRLPMPFSSNRKTMFLK